MQHGKGDCIALQGPILFHNFNANRSGIVSPIAKKGLPTHKTSKSSDELVAGDVVEKISGKGMNIIGIVQERFPDGKLEVTTYNHSKKISRQHYKNFIHRPDISSQSVMQPQRQAQDPLLSLCDTAIKPEGSLPMPSFFSQLPPSLPAQAHDELSNSMLMSSTLPQLPSPSSAKAQTFSQPWNVQDDFLDRVKFKIACNKPVPISQYTAEEIDAIAGDNELSIVSGSRGRFVEFADISALRRGATDIAAEVASHLGYPIVAVCIYTRKRGPNSTTVRDVEDFHAHVIK